MTGPVPAAQPRRRWWAELLLIAAVYALYSAGRLLATGSVAQAHEHGVRILDLEKALYLHAEEPLNRLFTTHAAIGVPADFAYATLHYLVTPAVLIWIWRRRHEHYRQLRSWLMGSTLIGLVGFVLLPTAPPRLLSDEHGFVDTMAQYSSYGWWGGEASAPRGLGGLTNQYAAMPSLHVGWALWCGLVVWRHARSRTVRVLALAYPAMTALVVMGTANHYLLDAVAGVAVMGAGYLAAGPLVRAADLAKAQARMALAPRRVPVRQGSIVAAKGGPGVVPTVVVGGGATDGATGTAGGGGSAGAAEVVGAGWKTAARGTHIPRPRTPADASGAAGPAAEPVAGDGGSAPAAAR
ncbi:phosphatase PAP2 family protein [Streptomyces sp. A7024]|uniref:Phosphatase PAP2 family protein n=1 Tax=Streptomyces coryli TaxID=1128680 RepID=A0A6G4UD68_9ACTN|nr:phosphatase PAP2 family protein [Streptomyces coryli]NGN70093.1 phosphatase PAP2 family protein [Streptomyces coryli]